MPCPPTTHFSWPPPPSDSDQRMTPTASPLYIPPPGTQRVQAKPKTCIDSTDLHSIEQGQCESVQVRDVIDIVPASWLTQESRSAPELTSINLKEHNECAESCSDSYTSTCTTTTTTSEEYQRMYIAQSALLQSQIYYDQSSTDLNSSNCDYEVVSIQQQNGSFSSASTDLMTFSGRRSTQECSDSIYNTINTCQLVDYIKESESSQSESKPVKRVEFSDDVIKVASDSLLQSVSSQSEVEVDQSTQSAAIEPTQNSTSESKFILWPHHHDNLSNISTVLQYYRHILTFIVLSFGKFSVLFHSEFPKVFL